MTEFVVDLFKEINSIPVSDAEELIQSFEETNSVLGEKIVFVLTDIFLKKAVVVLKVTQEKMQMSFKDHLNYHTKKQEHLTCSLSPEKEECIEFWGEYALLHEKKGFLTFLISSSIKNSKKDIGMGKLTIRKGWQVVSNPYIVTDMKIF
jgi:hypothetical protein